MGKSMRIPSKWLLMVITSVTILIEPSSAFTLFWKFTDDRYQFNNTGLDFSSINMVRINETNNTIGLVFITYHRSIYELIMLEKDFQTYAFKEPFSIYCDYNLTDSFPRLKKLVPTSEQMNEKERIPRINTMTMPSSQNGSDNHKGNKSEIFDLTFWISHPTYEFEMRKFSLLDKRGDVRANLTMEHCQNITFVSAWEYEMFWSLCLKNLTIIISKIVLSNQTLNIELKQSYRFVQQNVSDEIKFSLISDNDNTNHSKPFLNDLIVSGFAYRKQMYLFTKNFTFILDNLFMEFGDPATVKLNPCNGLNDCPVQKKLVYQFFYNESLWSRSLLEVIWYAIILATIVAILTAAYCCYYERKFDPLQPEIYVHKQPRLDSIPPSPVVPVVSQSSQQPPN